MRKLIITVFVLLSVGLLIVPALTGTLIKNATERWQPTVIQRTADLAVSVTSINIEPGWFSSQQQAQIEVKHPVLVTLINAFFDHSGPTNSHTLELDSDIAHGLIPWASKTAGGIKPALAHTDSELFVLGHDNRKNPLPLSVYSSQSLNSWFKLVAHSFERPFEIGNLKHADFGGAEFEITGRRNLILQGLVNASRFDLTTKNGPIALASGPWEVNYNQRLSDQGLEDLELELRGSTILLDAIRKKRQTTIESLTLNAQVDNHNQRIKVVLKLRADNTKIHTIVTSSTQINIQLEADRKALFDFVNAQDSLSSNSQAEYLNVDGMLAMQNLFSKGLKFSVEQFEINSDAKAVTASIEFEIPASNVSTKDLLNLATAYGSINLPKEMVTKLSQIWPEMDNAIALALLTNALTAEKDRYTSRFELADGYIKLNGFRMPIPFTL